MLNVNKNLGFLKAKGRWILNLDDDELIPEDLAEEIRRITQKKGRADGYWLPRKNIIFGKWIKHGLWWPDKQLRLFVNGKGTFPQKHVHEYIRIDGPTDTLTHPFIHHNYQNIQQYMDKMLTIYIPNEVETRKGYDVHWADALRFPASDFLKVYFAQDGYKDGLHGLVLAMLQGIYAFLVFVHLWEKKGFPEHEIPSASFRRESKTVAFDLRYWEYDRRIRSETNPVAVFLLRIGRKLRISL